MTNQHPNNPQFGQGQGQQGPAYAPHNGAPNQYGQQPPQGPQKSNTGLIATIVAIVAAIAIAAGVWFFTRDDEEPNSEPTAVTTTDPAPVETDEESSDPVEEETTEPAEETTDPVEEETTDPAEEETTDPAPAGETSKEAYRDGIEAATEAAGYSRDELKQSGLTDDLIDDYYACLADESFDSVSEAFKAEIAGGGQGLGASQEDIEAFTTATTTCANKLADSLM